MPVRIFFLSNFLLLLQALADMAIAQPLALSLVGTASTLERAVEAVVQSGAEVLLLDIDGDEEADKLLSLIRSLFTGQQTKVLMLSRHHNDSLLDQAIRCGARGLIDHNTSPERLVHAVQKVCEGHIWLDHKTTSRFFGAFTHGAAGHAGGGGADPSPRRALVRARKRHRQHHRPTQQRLGQSHRQSVVHQRIHAALPLDLDLQKIGPK